MAIIPSNVPRKWAQHPFTWLPGGVFAIIGGIISLVYVFKVLGGILFLLGFFRGDNAVEYLAPLWVLIDGIILLIVASIARGGVSRFIGGLRRTWTLNDYKIVEQYDGIARSNDELHYHRISEVAIYQGMWGRIFGYGTLTLTLQGRDGRWYIPNAPRPYALRDYFSVIAEQNNQRQSQP